ncbi:hypothetical protein [Actinocorallia populi]|uniref:hypothetical protein n=1 Tax=Actinocorallia populi TaxID=2079200 RepID=UPI000D091655|nr:hypothetical protein [Actinocorallia populi]
MDAEGGAAAAAEALADPRPAGRTVRRAEVVAALLASGGRWTPALTAVPLDSFDEDPCALDVVVAALARRNAWETACELVEAALLRACSAGGQGLYEAFWTAERLCGEFRSAPARLLPALRTVLAWRGEGPHVHPWVASLPGDAAELIGQLGTDAAPALDALASLAGDAVPPENADRALAALIRLGDDRSPSLLAENLPDRPRALRSAVDHGLPFAPVLLTAIREHLRTSASGENERTAGPPEDGTERFALMLALLRSWGPQAREALPELCDALKGEAPATPPAARTAPERAKSAAVPSQGAPRGRTRTADRTPAQSTLSSRERASAATTADRPLVPEPSRTPAETRTLDDGVLERLAATLAAVCDSETGRRRAEAALRQAVSGGEARTRLGAARALWRLTGDAAPLLAELAVLLGGKATRRSVPLQQNTTAYRDPGGKSPQEGETPRQNTAAAYRESDGKSSREDKAPRQNTVTAYREPSGKSPQEGETPRQNTAAAYQEPEGKSSREDKALRQEAAEACRELGEDARPLLGVLLALLARPKPRRLFWLVDVAVTVWRLTGESEHVLPVLDAALAAPSSAAKAVRAVRELGSAASGLAERVACRLYDLYEVPETVRALVGVCSDGRRPPAGCSPARLIDLLLACAGEARDPSPAFEVIAELGAEHLTEVHRRLLHGYATHEQRVPRKHSPHDIAADGVLRAAARNLLVSIGAEEALP